MFGHTKFELVDIYQMGYAFIGKPLLTSRCYSIDGLLIDTGMRHLYRPLLEKLSSKNIEQIALTHYHEDHSGNAEKLRQQFNAKLLVGELTAEKCSAKLPLKPYQLWNFGQITPITHATTLPPIIETPHHKFETIFTPGHTPDHFSFFERNKGYLFSGDLFLGNIKFTRREENLADMIQSIQRILKLDFEVLFCAHNPKMSEGKKHFKLKLQYLQDFVAKVKELALERRSIASICKRLQKKEVYLIKLITFNDAGLDIMVQSALKPAEFD